MRIHSKLALAALLLAFGLPAAYAQTQGSGGAGQQGPVGPVRMIRIQKMMRGPGCAAPGQMRAWGRNGRMGMGMRMRGGMGMGMRMGMRGWGHAGRGWMLMGLVNNPEMRKQLGITDQQAASIRQKTTAFLKERIRSRANLAIQRVNLHELMQAEHPDRAKIDATLEQISSLQLAQAKAAVNFRLDMKEALTPAQRQKLMQMRQRFMRWGHGQRGMPGRRGPNGGMKQQSGSGSGSN